MAFGVRADAVRPAHFFKKIPYNMHIKIKIGKPEA
jgi:hypothetical protein